MNVTNFVINATKTESSQRWVPVHLNLIELGLEKLIALRKKQGKIRLFPDLTRGKWKGTLSDNFSNKFNYYRRTNDVYWPSLDFHAFRTTANNFLMSDNGSDAIRRRIMGHAPRRATCAPKTPGVNVCAQIVRLSSSEQTRFFSPFFPTITYLKIVVRLPVCRLELLDPVRSLR
ncbi:MAG: hypothetical protein Q4P24_11005, partial [Rhodobacterales bacterium]|nr:hypothetical protein [Rhodobacterales bacterium]